SRTRFSAPTPRGCSAFPFDRAATKAWVRDSSPREGTRAPTDPRHARQTASLSPSAVQGQWSMADVEIVLHPIPTPQSKPYIIVFGPDRHLWFCENGTSKIGRMNPSNGSFIEFDTPTPN